MKSSKPTLKQALLLTIIVVGTLAQILLVYTSLKRPSLKPAIHLNTSNIAQSQNNSTKAIPIRLKIPKLNVDAAVEQMGLTPNGDMEAPNNPKNVGWYKFGPYPGENGNAVIDGHYGIWQNGERSVFDDLKTLKIGDKLIIENNNDTTITFVVRDFKTYGKDADTSEVFKSNDNKAHLNLITCDGSWEAATKSYTNRFVVFADKDSN